MLKKSMLALASTLMLGVFVLTAMPSLATTTTAVAVVDAGDCEKCGSKECKGSCGEAKSEAKEQAGEKKSCASTGEGKSACCAHGQSKKEEKAEEKKK